MESTHSATQIEEQAELCHCHSQEAMGECVQAGLSSPWDPARSSGAETPFTSASHPQSFAEP